MRRWRVANSRSGCDRREYAPGSAELFFRTFWHALLRSLGSSSYYPYRVVLTGQPLWWETEGGRVEKIGGFFATRIVLAESPSDAIQRAKEIVSAEIAPMVRNPPDMPVQYELDRCEKMSGVAAKAPHGFSFWLEDHESEPPRPGSH